MDDIQETILFNEPAEAEIIRAQHEYYEREFDVMCDICGEQTRASESELRRDGWGFWPGSGQELCPMCEEAI